SYRASRLHDGSEFVSVSLSPFPVQSRRIGPEFFETVVTACLRVEHMDDDIAVVLNDPLAGLVAFDAQADLALAAHGRVGFCGEGVELAAAGAAGQHKEVIQRSHPPHVQDDDITGLVVRSHPSAQARTLEGDRRTRGRLNGYRCSLQWTSFNG